MKAFLYKLRFETAVHFGASDSALSLYVSEDHFCADTLFSALCHTANALYGPEGAAALCADAKKGELLLSDSMPWRESASGEDTLFLPRPMMVSQSRRETDPSRRKDMKKLNWLPVSSLEDFTASIRGETEFDISGILRDFGKNFGRAGVTERASIAREAGKDANPYPVGLFHFHQGRDALPDCGLYVLALFQDAALSGQLLTLLKVLGMTGIGGKISSGYGKFSVKETIDLDCPPDAQTAWLRDALRRKDAAGQLLLTASLPRPEEMETALDGAYFQMIRRAGFVRPAGEEKQGRKKRTQYFLAAGSVLRRRFSGDVYPVGNVPPSGGGVRTDNGAARTDGGESVPVLRYGRPVFLGIPSAETDDAGENIGGNG